MIESQKNMVGIKFNFINLDLNDYYFIIENNNITFNIQYNDIDETFNFFLSELFYNNPDFIDLKYIENTINIKQDIFDKKFDFNYGNKMNNFQEFNDDIFSKKNLSNYNYKKQLNTNNKLGNSMVSNNLFKMTNGNVETSLDIKGKIYEYNYFINFDSKDNMIISADYNENFGVLIKKTEDYNLLNIFNSYNFNSNKLKFNYNYYDKKLESNHESSLIYFNKYFNYSLGSLIQLNSIFDISELAVGFKIGEYKEIDNLELNYSYDNDNNNNNLEGLIEFTAYDLISSCYFDYFNDNFNSLSYIRRILKKN